MEEEYTDHDSRSNNNSTPNIKNNRRVVFPFIHPSAAADTNGDNNNECDDNNEFDEVDEEQQQEKEQLIIKDEEGGVLDYNQQDLTDFSNHIDEENQQSHVFVSPRENQSHAGGSNAFELIQIELMEVKSKAVMAMAIAVESNKAAYEAKKVASEAKEELDTTKAELSATIARLESRISPGSREEIYDAPQLQIRPLRQEVHDSFNNYHESSLSEDTYTLMMTKKIFSRSWFFGFAMFIIQITLLGLIFHDQIRSSQKSTLFDIPFKVSNDVRIAQFLAIFLSIMISYDIFMPIKELSMLWITNKENWTKVVDTMETVNYDSPREMQNDLSGRPFSHIRNVWLLHIFFPVVLKFVQGVLVLLITFVIVIQSDDIIDLFKDFAAMQVISEMDNVAFGLASHGFFGKALKRDSDTASNVKVRDEIRKICFGLPLRPVVMLSLLITMTSAFVGLVVVGQQNGAHFEQKYPNCNVRFDQIQNITDGNCNGGLPNTFQCGFDGGDCIDFNIAFPNCKALNAYEVGDGTCHEELNVKECGYDGGDCCHMKLDPNYLNDGECNGGLYNTLYCGYDQGDCDQFRNENPLCPDLELADDQLYKDDGSPIVLGDGICDFIPEYMTGECGYESGDCSDCKVPNPTKLGDGTCNGGVYNTEACGFDLGDCLKCNKIVDDPIRVGDGTCDGGIYMSEVCNDDGGDCRKCIVDKNEFVGNGICNGGDYMSESCGNDGGDCKECVVENPFLIGNNVCSGGIYNTEECAFDGGDCDECNSLIGVENSGSVGNGVCDGGQLNTDECDWDGGDCKCLYDASNGECDIKSSTMLVECGSSCKMSPLLLSTKNNTVFQLQSTSKTSLCLTASSNEEFARLVYSQCSTANLNQDFFMRKQDAFSGEINALRNLESKSCLQMVDTNPLELNPIIMHSDCTDLWEVLDSGALKSVARGKCIGKDRSDPIQIVAVECDSKDVEVWSVIDNQYELFNIRFETMSSSQDHSGGPFEIDGYGEIPKNCYNNRGADCDVQIYGMKTLTIRAKTIDAWNFTITGDIGNILRYETVSNKAHIDPFPTVMDTDEHDISQTYVLKMYDGTECYDIHLKTLKASNTPSSITNSFTIDGYGYVPSECYSNPDDECDIQICGRRTLVLRAYTTNEWQFEVSGDIGNLREYKTVAGGTHETIATMDVDEYDYVQVYDLVPYSSCTYRAVKGGECDSNLEYMQKHCNTACNFMPMYNGNTVQLESSNQTSMCLTAVEENNLGRLYYSQCDGTNLYQNFVFESLRSDLFLSFGRLRTSIDYDYCVEMHNTHEDPAFLHTDCQDTWEILENGALKNIKKAKCLGKVETDSTIIRAVDCDSEDVETWNATEPISSSKQRDRIQLPSIEPSETPSSTSESRIPSSEVPGKLSSSASEKPSITPSRALSMAPSDKPLDIFEMDFGRG